MIDKRGLFIEKFEENTFTTTVSHFKTNLGDKILYPFGPPIFQTIVDQKFVDELITEGRKLTIKDNDHNFRLAGNLKKGRSYLYTDDFLINKAEPYMLKHVERFFDGLHQQFGNNYEGIKNLFQSSLLTLAG